jgi:hypothetical protein
MNLEFSRQIFENNKILLKSFLREPNCFMRMDGRTDGRADTRTDKTKLIVACRNFAKTPKSFSILMGRMNNISVIEEADKDNKNLKCLNRILRKNRRFCEKIISLYLLRICHIMSRNDS